MICSRRHAGHRGAARNDRQQIVPAAANAAAMLLDQFAEGNAHRLFDIAGLVHMARDAEELGADIVGPADAENQAAPRRMMVPATAIDSTLLMVVGAP